MFPFRAPWVASLVLVASACAHSQPVKCPEAEATPQVAAVSLPPSLGWVDPRALDAPPAPLALYDLDWMLMTGDSGALVEAPAQLHSFTLGRWECALGAERADDTLEQGAASVRRARKLVCTHKTGLTMQTEVACAYRMPAAAEEGSPAHARREARIALGDAPALMLACEPTPSESVPLFKADHEPLGRACLVAGRVAPCADGKP